MSLGRNDTARPREQANNEHARDSRSSRAVVVLLKASETVQNGVETDVANDTAQSQPRHRLVGLFEKVREFGEMAKRASIPA
jgi:hypothetical protein